jgi:hypothetical protein
MEFGRGCVLGVWAPREPGRDLRYSQTGKGARAAMRSCTHAVVGVCISRMFCASCACITAVQPIGSPSSHCISPVVAVASALGSPQACTYLLSSRV